MSNIPYKICTFIALFLLFLINFNLCNAQILTQPRIGTITSINEGTDRIIHMLQEDDEEYEEQNIPSETSEEKIPQSNPIVKNEDSQYIEKENEDIEIFEPHSNPNIWQNQNHNENSHEENALKENAVNKIRNDCSNVNHTSKNDVKSTNNRINSSTNERIIAAVSGGIHKINTGNSGEIKNHITGFDIAVIRELKNTHSKLKIGGVIDYNHNKYDNEANGILGSGKSNALMVGVLARQMGKNNFYYEGSARFGRAKTDLNSNNFGINTISYKESAPTYAGHAKLGKIIKLNDKNSVDVYGLYSFAHQDRVNVNISSNETYNLGSLYSSKLKTGCRMTTKVKNGKIYYGLAYQYEARAKIKSRQNGIETGISSGRGNSGLIELGYKLSINKDKSASIDLNASGFSGRQKGFTFQAQFVKMI